jgi:hypothetical protein
MTRQLLLAAAISMPASASTLYFTDVQIFDSLNVTDNFQPNGASATNSDMVIENFNGTANLTAGTLRMLSSGTAPGPLVSTYSPFIAVQFGDTITAAGPTAGKSLGVNLAVNGTTSFSDASQNFAAIIVAAYPVGSFDNGGTPLWSEFFYLGGGTYVDSNYLSSHGFTVTGTYGPGNQSIPLSIPFSTLGSSFQLVVGLIDEENINAPSGTTWSVDYSHTLTATLVAPSGVNLSSPGGLAAASAVPEPASLVLISTALALFALRRIRPAR